MKEISIEQKAEAYNKALEKARKELQACGSTDCDATRQIFRFFPELKEHIESENEKIRKWLIALIKSNEYGSISNVGEMPCPKLNVLAWLEKQGNLMKALQTSNAEIGELIEKNYYLKEQVEKQDEQNNNEDEAILHRFSFYSYKDEPNILYLAGLYVNDKYRNKGIGTKILEVADEVAKSLNYHAIRLKTKKDSNAERLYQTHGYNSLATEEKDKIWLEKQCEQKSIWSEEDDYNLQCMIAKVTSDIQKGNVGRNQELIDWFKSLKYRYTWKPTEEQMKFLYKYAEQNNYDGAILTSLYNDLKQL